MAIITITRGAYSGVEALAKLISEELGYRRFTREELLRVAAETFGTSESELESALANTPGFLEGRGLKKRHFIYCAQATIAKAVQSDNVVYHGQAGHVLLKGIPHHLRVGVLANREYRIGATMKRCDLTRGKAIQYLKELDQKQSNWMKWLHGVDMNDPASQDLMLNLENLPVSSAAATIVQMAKRDFATTPESQKIVDDLVVASEVRAKLGMDPDISDDRIQVDADDGVVTITATVRYLANAAKVRELVQAVPGVKDIRGRGGAQL
jgi:cytidylate kinase